MIVTSGYSHERYAASLAAFGVPRLLESSGAWLLERSIPGTAARDAMGCYPIFVVPRWAHLRDDFSQLADEIVSITVVTDPFGGQQEADLWRVFDFVRPFKEHVIVDLERVAPSAHHRYRVRSSLKHLRVDEVDPGTFLDEWCRLYDVLTARHRLSGIHALSRTAFALQLSVPGARVFRATAGDRVVGGQVWYVSGDLAYAHLMALDARGYELGASYALCAESFRMLRPTVTRVNLGGGAGIDPSPGDGLTYFKRGWSTETATVYLCGRILDRQRYASLSTNVGIGYFPAYRTGEFASSASRVLA